MWRGLLRRLRQLWVDRYFQVGFPAQDLALEQVLRDRGSDETPREPALGVWSLCPLVAAGGDWLDLDLAVWVTPEKTDQHCLREIQSSMENQAWC